MRARSGQCGAAGSQRAARRRPAGGRRGPSPCRCRRRWSRCRRWRAPAVRRPRPAPPRPARRCRTCRRCRGSGVPPGSRVRPDAAASSTTAVRGVGPPRATGRRWRGRLRRSGRGRCARGPPAGGQQDRHGALAAVGHRVPPHLERRPRTATASRRPASIAAATSCAGRLPLNESGATTTVSRDAAVTPVLSRCRGSLLRDPRFGSLPGQGGWSGLRRTGASRAIRAYGGPVTSAPAVARGRGVLPRGLPLLVAARVPRRGLWLRPGRAGARRVGADRHRRRAAHRAALAARRGARRAARRHGRGRRQPGAHHPGLARLPGRPTSPPVARCAGWASRSGPAARDAELAECHQHESLLNLAFEGRPAWRLMCPYDVTALPGEVIEEARANHPLVLDDGQLVAQRPLPRRATAPRPAAPAAAAAG